MEMVQSHPALWHLSTPLLRFLFAFRNAKHILHQNSISAPTGILAKCSWANGIELSNLVAKCASLSGSSHLIAISNSHILRDVSFCVLVRARPFIFYHSPLRRATKSPESYIVCCQLHYQYYNIGSRPLSNFSTRPPPMCKKRLNADMEHFKANAKSKASVVVRDM